MVSVLIAIDSRAIRETFTTSICVPVALFPSPVVGAVIDTMSLLPRPLRAEAS